MTAVVALALVASPGYSSESVADRQYRDLLERLKLYRDGLEKSARLLTLDDAIALGLRNNPSLREADAGIQESDWSLVAIQREWWPSLRGGSSAPGVLGWTSSSSSERVRSVTGWNETLTVKTSQVSLPALSLNWEFLDPSRNSRAQASRSEIAARRFLFLVDARRLILKSSRLISRFRSNISLNSPIASLSDKSPNSLRQASWLAMIPASATSCSPSDSPC
jgi:outer membrane protein TolC